jgi:hypothetical protein
LNRILVQVRNIYRLRFLGRMLLAWRHGISPSRSYAHRRAEPLSFGEKRSLADLGTARAHVLTVLKRSLVRNIRYRNTKHVFSLKKAVCLGPGFKATMRAFEDEVRRLIGTWTTREGHSCLGLCVPRC